MKSEADAPGPLAGAGIIGKLAADLATEGDLPELLKRFLEPLLRMSGACAGAVRAITDDGDQLELIGSLGLPQQVSQAECTVGRDCGACGTAASDEAPVWADDLDGCARLSSVDYFGGDVRRMVAVPLGYRKRVLGVYKAECLRRIARSDGERVLDLEGHGRFRIENAGMTVRGQHARGADDAARLLAGRSHAALARNQLRVHRYLLAIGERESG